jgi:pyrimidine-nucleoside phosphorylase
VRAQGGDLTKPLVHAPNKVQWKAKRRGYLAKMNTESLGKILIEMGGGRKKASDVIHLGVGIVFHKKLGSYVHAGDTLATVYASETLDLAPLEDLFQQSIEMTSARKGVPKLIYETVNDKNH